tara:strand:- start:851 stop:3604 length:2754 start_codon:yes stop_codon:yes gene_type:complete
VALRTAGGEVLRLHTTTANNRPKIWKGIIQRHRAKECAALLGGDEDEDDGVPGNADDGGAARGRAQQSWWGSDSDESSSSDEGGGVDWGGDDDAPAEDAFDPPQEGALVLCLDRVQVALTDLYLDNVAMMDGAPDEDAARKRVNELTEEWMHSELHLACADLLRGGGGLGLSQDQVDAFKETMSAEFFSLRGEADDEGSDSAISLADQTFSELVEALDSPLFKAWNMDVDFHLDLTGRACVYVDPRFMLVMEKRNLVGTRESIFRTPFRAKLYLLDSVSPASQTQLQSFLNILWETPELASGLSEVGAPRSLKQLRRFSEQNMPSFELKKVPVTSIPAKSKKPEAAHGIFSPIIDQVAVLLSDPQKAKMFNFKYCPPASDADRMTTFNSTPAFGDAFDHCRSNDALCIPIQLFLDDYDDLGMGGKSSAGQNNKKAVLGKCLNVHRNASSHPDFVLLTGWFRKDAVMNEVLKIVIEGGGFDQVHLFWHGGLQTWVPIILCLCLIVADRKERNKILMMMDGMSENGKSFSDWISEHELKLKKMPTGLAPRTVAEARQHQNELNQMKLTSDPGLGARESELARRATFDGKPVYLLALQLPYFNSITSVHIAIRHALSEGLDKRGLGKIVLSEISKAEPSQNTRGLIAKLRARIKAIQAFGIPFRYRQVNNSVLLSYKRWSWMQLEFFIAIAIFLIVGLGPTPRHWGAVASTYLIALATLTALVYVPNGMSKNETDEVERQCAKVWSAEFLYWQERGELEKLVYPNRTGLLEIAPALRRMGPPHNTWDEGAYEGMFGQVGGHKWAMKKSNRQGDQLSLVSRIMLRCRIALSTLRSRFGSFLSAHVRRYEKLETDEAGAEGTGAEDIPFRHFVGGGGMTSKKLSERERKRFLPLVNNYGHDLKWRSIPKTLTLFEHMTYKST